MVTLNAAVEESTVGERVALLETAEFILELRRLVVLGQWPEVRLRLESPPATVSDVVAASQCSCKAAAREARKSKQSSANKVSKLSKTSKLGFVVWSVV